MQKQNTKIIKQKYKTKNKHKKNIIKHESSNQKVTEKQIIMTRRTAQNLHIAA